MIGAKMSFLPNLSGRARLLAVLLLCVSQAGRAMAATPVRVAILPPDFESPRLEVKQYSETLADYLQGKLRDIPGVEWVERGDLDKLLAEVRPALDNGASVSPMVLGRLLKADVILTGHLDGWSAKIQDGKPEFSYGLELQVIDLTNASVLAREKWEYSNEVAGVSFGFPIQMTEPGKVASLIPLLRPGGPEPDPDLQKLQEMEPDKVAALVRKLQAAEMEKAVAVARKLLTSGLVERRATAAATNLVPIFFADAGSGQNFGDWEGRWQSTLREEAAAQPSVRLRQFLGIEQARQEQKLALLGLTQADPAAWQSTADGYVWGSYQVVPGTQTMEAGETEVEVEVFLQLGEDEPKRFARRFNAKDFPDAIRALAREVLDAARGKHPRRSSEASVKIARMIFKRLCTLVKGGFFQDDPPLASTLPPPGRGVLIGTYGEAVLDPIMRLPQAPERLAYCQRMLDLACFFDPADNRLRMLRWTLANARGRSTGDPDRQLEPMVECVELLERIAHARVFDVGTFVTGVDAAMSRLVYWQTQPGWTVEVGLWQTKSVFPAQLNAQHEALLGILFPLLLEKLPALSERLDEAKVSPPERRFLVQWLTTVLRGEVKPEFRLEYLAAARKLTPLEGDLTQAYLRLMDDLGDRKRVQSVLMKSEPFSMRPTPRPGQSAQSVPPRMTPPVPPPADASTRNVQAMLAGWKPVEPPPIRRVVLPLDRFGVGHHARLPAGRTPEEKLALAIDPVMGRGAAIRRIDGFGDQLVLGLSTAEPLARGDGLDFHLLFQTSSEAVQVLGATTSGVVYGEDARVLYRKGEFTGWTDLLTAKSGGFSPDTGSPVATPAVVGFDGTGRALVAEGGGRTVALYDWNKRGWLILPPPPAVPPVNAPSDLRSAPPAPAEAFGTGDAIVFPIWNLIFDQAKQRWRTLPDDACRPLVCLPPDTFSPSDLPVMGGRFCVDGHLWSWNARGITDFSVVENRVVWHDDALHLRGVCQDGPYLWMALDGAGAPSVPGESLLVLFDRKQHAVLGVVNPHRMITALHADDRQLWLGTAGNNVRGQISLLCMNKARLYTALPGTVFPKAARRRRPPLENAESALYAAILGNDPEAMRQLLDRGVSANAVFGDGQTPALMVAAWTGSETLCRVLLEHGAKPDALPPTDHKAWTALATAARQDDPPLLQILLEAGAKPTETALTEALRNEDFEASASLIKAGAPLGNLTAVINERQNEELARRVLNLHLPLPAAEQAQLALLSKTNDEPIPGLGDDPKKTAELLLRAATARRKDQAARIVRQVPAACLRRPELRSSFIGMIQYGCLSAVDAFLDAGVSPSADSHERVPGGRGPLDEALSHPDIFALLLRRGADPRLSDAQGSTLAERAFGLTAAAILPELLERYPALETRHGYGTFGGSLLCAAATGWPHENLSLRASEPSPLATRTLQMLLDRGVSPSAVGREGFTALHGAFAARSAPLACWLAGAGADLHARDLAGRTVFDVPYCYVGQRSGFIEKLRTYVPSSDQEAKGQQRLLSEVADRGSYPELFDAVGRKDLAHVREMLQKGWSLVPPVNESDDPENNFLRRPGLVFLAVKNGQREMVRLLLEHGSDANVGENGCDFYPSNDSLLARTVQPSSSYKRPLPSNQCLTPLIAAAAAGDLPLVDLLLDHGAYAPVIDQFVRNAVDAAATPELAAHIEHRSHAQFAAEKLLDALGLRSTGREDDRSLQQILTETPAALLTPDAAGRTPLSREVALVGSQPRWEEWPLVSMNSDAIERLELLHRNGIRLDSLDDYGTTPLHRAVLYARVQDAAVLVKTGFDPAFPDRRGVTSMDLVEGILDPKQRGDMLAALQGTPISETGSPKASP